MHLIIPAITPIQQSFQISSGVSALLISATLWGIAFSSLFFGVLADRFGRRHMLMLGLGLFVAGSALGALGDSAAMVIAGRVVQGIGGAAGMIVSRAVVRDLYDRKKGTSILAYVTMAVMVAPILAPAFAGFVVHELGWRVVFEIAGVLGFFVMIWLLNHFPETLKNHIPLPNFGSLILAYASVLRAPVFVFYTLIITFVMTSFFSMMSGAPYVAEQMWGLHGDELGFYLGVGGFGMVLSTFITARIAERTDPDKILVVGLSCVVGGVGGVAILFAAGVNHPASLFGPMILTGFGAGFCMPMATASALSIVPRMAGTASGVMSFLQFTIAGIAAQAIGYFDHHTPWSVIGFMAVAVMLAVISALFAVYFSHQSQPAE